MGRSPPARHLGHPPAGWSGIYGGWTAGL